jgi:hypothetical protein
MNTLNAMALVSAVRPVRDQANVAVRNADPLQLDNRVLRIGEIIKKANNDLTQGTRPRLVRQSLRVAKIASAPRCALSLFVEDRRDNDV